MKDIAKRERLDITETITESHSAKESGQLPEFNNLQIQQHPHMGTRSVISNWRREWDGFRQTDWIEIADYPELMHQQAQQLLSSV